MKPNKICHDEVRKYTNEEQKREEKEKRKMATLSSDRLILARLLSTDT